MDHTEGTLLLPAPAGRWLNPALGLFLLRLVVGLVFISHGVAKFQNMEGTITFFASLGMPAFLAYFVATVETLGGLALILGLFSRLAGILLAIVMVVAVYSVTWPSGGWTGSELELTLLASNLALALIGPGAWAIKKNL